MPVSLYMHSPVAVAHLGDNLVHIRDELEARRFSSLPVVNDQGDAVGVISRTDLLRVGRLEAGTPGRGRRPKAALLVLPDRAVEEVMARPVAVVSPDTTVSACAALMRQRRVHRLFVTDGPRLVGVFSTRDLMDAVSRARVPGKVRDFMSTPIFTIRVDEPIALATDRLARAHVSGLVVVDDGWPVGVFTQTEALEAAAMPRDTAVEEAFSPALICMSQDTPLHRAAAQAAATSVRRVIATHRSEMMGILTGLDFARAAC